MPFTGGQYKPLTDEQVKIMHEHALKVLEEIGVKVFTETGRAHFKRCGANVDENTGIVKIPRAMVEDAIESAPHRLVLCGRDPKNDIVLEGSNVTLGTGGTAINVLDLETLERRPSYLRDVSDMAKLMDTLKNVGIFTINVYPNEITANNDVDINRFYWSIKNTSKHIMGGIYSLEGTKQVVDMASMIAGGIDKLRERPFVSFITLNISPLKIDDIYGEMTCYLAEQGLPVVVPTEPLCGITSPVTLASNVLMHVSESLAGVVMTQLINKGCPVLFGSVGSITNMRTMEHLSGAVERGILNAAVSQMAQFYRLPNYSTAGTTDSKMVDAQAGYESGMSNLLVAMSGANYIHDAAGLMEFDLTCSYEKLVIDDEILGRAFRVLRGIEVNENTLAFDLIKDVGPAGDFLYQEHTVRYMRKEFAPITVSDQRTRAHWEAAGSLDAAARARQIAINAIATHTPMDIPAEIDEAIRSKFDNLLKSDRELAGV